jgi:hypothetical protein
MKQRARHLNVAAAVLLSLIALSIDCCRNAVWAFDPTHKVLDAELHKYTTKNGVHYKHWQKHPEILQQYLDSLASLNADEYATLSAQDKAALWLNAYCALTIKVILEHYPIDGTKSYYPNNSIRQIPNCWESDFINVAGRKLNLWQMYHDVIRKDLKDIRTHFGIFCGANGCSVQREAYTGAKLDDQLDDAMQKYLADKRNVEVDRTNRKIYVAQVFKWFPLDFAPDAGFQKFPFPPPTDDEIVLAYLSIHGSTDVQHALAGVRNRSEFKVAYRNFDWSLNDVDGPAPHMPPGSGEPPAHPRQNAEDSSMPAEETAQSAGAPKADK